MPKSSPKTTLPQTTVSNAQIQAIQQGYANLYQQKIQEMQAAMQSNFMQGVATAATLGATYATKAILSQAPPSLPTNATSTSMQRSESGHSMTHWLIF